MDKKELILLRGLPGAGKSTFAQLFKQGHPNTYLLEADMYFFVEGEYVFNPRMLHLAHKWCYNKARLFMDLGGSRLVVSNTFTTEKELRPYIDLATEFNYNTTSLIIENRHGNKSVHDVPPETVEKMRNRFTIKL